MPGKTSTNASSNDVEMSMTMNPNPGGAHAPSHAHPHSNITYAKALNDAKTLIVQQSARIKADAQKMRAQAEEAAQLRATVEALSLEVDRLRALEPRLADAVAGREQAESLVGRQRMEIESLETASRELQRMLGEQAARINELTAEGEQLRSHLPTDEDAAALEQMAALLSTARSKSRPQAPPAPDERLERISGPGLARQHRDRQLAEAREREIREGREREMTIPAEPTPFCVVNQRQAA